MLMNLFIIWVLISVFVGSKEANEFFRGMIGLLVGLWALRVIVRFGIRCLPMIIVIALFSRIVIPFVKGFLSSWDRH